MHLRVLAYLVLAAARQNLAEMKRQTQIGLGSTVSYTSIDDQYEAYGIYRAVYSLLGDQKTVAALQAEQRRMLAAGANGGQSQGGSGFGALINSWANSATTKE